MCRLSIWRIKRPFEDKLCLVQSVHYTPSQKYGPGRGRSTIKVDKGAKIARWGQSVETSGWQQPRGMRWPRLRKLLGALSPSSDSHPINWQLTTCKIQKTERRTEQHSIFKATVTVHLRKAKHCAKEISLMFLLCTFSPLISLIIMRGRHCSLIHRWGSHGHRLRWDSNSDPPPPTHTLENLYLFFKPHHREDEYNYLCLWWHENFSRLPHIYQYVLFLKNHLLFLKNHISHT